MCQFSIDVFGPGLQIASTDPNKTWPIFTEVWKKNSLWLLLIFQLTYCGNINPLWVRLEWGNKDDAFKYAQYLVSGISGLKMHKLFNVESKCACVNNFWRIKSQKCVTKITFWVKVASAVSLQSCKTIACQHDVFSFFISGHFLGSKEGIDNHRSYSWTSC